MNKQPVIITGGTGYIGSHTAVVLIEAGYPVVIWDNLSNSRAEVIDRIQRITGIRPTFQQIDLRRKEQIRQALQAIPMPAAIIHFAALKSVEESVREPLMYYENNILGLLNLLDVLPAETPFLFSSSCTVYGEPDNVPITEEAPFKPAASPYGATKQMSEQILSDMARARRQPVIALRYFNPAGAHPSALLGEFPLQPPTNLVPVMTQAAIGRRDKIIVFGNDYPTPDGTPIRDYIHIMDLAEAHLAALRRMLNHRTDALSEAFNVGTGQGYSVLEMIHTFEAVNGIKVPHEIGPRRPGDITAIWADPSLAAQKLGWKAQRGLEDMLRSAWAWEKTLAQP